MVNDQIHGRAWQHVRAVFSRVAFSLNDPRWGRDAGAERPAETDAAKGSDADAAVPKTPDDAAVDRAVPPRGAAPDGVRQQRDPNEPRPGGDRGKGGKPGEGPPDLDELWREFNARLQRFLGGGKNGGNGSRPGDGSGRGGSSRSGKVGVGVVLGAIVLIWLGSGIYIVQEGQAGVVLRFGQYVRTSPAGVQWRAPWPFESNETVNMSQIRSIEVGRNGPIAATNSNDSSMLTADENIIDVRFAVQYRIKDAADFLFNNASAEDNVGQAAETAVREIVGKNKMDFVLYEGREQVAQELGQAIQKILDSYKDGILVTSVTLQNVQPPQQVQAAFDDAVKAGQDRERLTNEAQAYVKNVVPRAKGTAARMLEEAEGYKARVIAQATGDAARFDAVEAEYAKAPAITRERIYLDTMQQIYSRSSKVLVDGRGNNNLIYLPLDKIISSQGSGGGMGSGTAGANAGRPQLSAGGIEDLNADQPSSGLASPGNARSDGSGSNGNSAMSSSAGSDDDPLRNRSVFRSRDRSQSLQDVPGTPGGQ